MYVLGMVDGFNTEFQTPDTVRKVSGNNTHKRRPFESGFQ